MATPTPTPQGRGVKAFTQASPTTSATLLLAANNGRVKALLANAGSATVYLGKDNTVTPSTGLPLVAGAIYEDEASLDAWYGILAAGTGDVRIVEIS